MAENNTILEKLDGLVARFEEVSTLIQTPSSPIRARRASSACREQGVEQIEFVTSFKTTTLSVAELLAEGGSWFALEHNGLGSRRLSAAQAESLKCRMH